MTTRNPAEELRLRGGSDGWDSGPAGALITLEFFGAPPPPSGGTALKVWNGSAFVSKPVKVWTGAAWVTKPLKRWSGTAWV